VGIARALAADQPILLLDEPFGRLDPITREEVREDFGALCRRLNKTVVFVTHDLREALLLADQIALLREGNLTFLGTPQDFLDSHDSHALAYRKTLQMPASFL
jgi:osmoprotectant transport system ATP-binding protein